MDQKLIKVVMCEKERSHKPRWPSRRQAGWPQEEQIFCGKYERTTARRNGREFHRKPIVW